MEELNLAIFPEDMEVVVVDKSKSMVVHPATGHLWNIGVLDLNCKNEGMDFKRGVPFASIGSPLLK